MVVARGLVTPVPRVGVLAVLDLAAAVLIGCERVLLGELNVDIVRLDVRVAVFAVVEADIRALAVRVGVRPLTRIKTRQGSLM